MQDLDHIWRSRLAMQTKIRLYNVCIVPIALYASETWTINQSDTDKIDAFDQWCLRRICNVRWFDRVTNVEIRRRTAQAPLSQAVARRRLTLFGHVARMDRRRDTSRALRARVPKGWKRPVGRPRATWTSTVEKDVAPLGFGLHTALKKAENRPGWRRCIHAATLPQ